jgi:hypothetical protein
MSGRRGADSQRPVPNGTLGWASMPTRCLGQSNAGTDRTADTGRAVVAGSHVPFAGAWQTRICFCRSAVWLRAGMGEHPARRPIWSGYGVVHRCRWPTSNCPMTANDRVLQRATHRGLSRGRNRSLGAPWQVSTCQIARPPRGKTTRKDQISEPSESSQAQRRSPSGGPKQ